jgi:hypothetical protein
VYEVNWDHSWTDNPKMWHAIYARHINALSFDNSYVKNQAEKGSGFPQLLKSVITYFHVACGASGLNQLCAKPGKNENGMISEVSELLDEAYEKERNKRKAKLALATDAADIQVQRSADYLLLINRIKQLPANTKTGKSCLEHPFSAEKEIARMREISRHFRPRTKPK